MEQGFNIEEGIVKNLTFNPSRDFLGGDIRLFGLTVRQQGQKLVIIIKIYEEGRREEILNKTKIMTEIMMTVAKHQGIKRIHIVDSKDILDQISKHKIDPKGFGENLKQKQDVTVEVIDLITGEYVPVEFSVGLMKNK